MVSKWLLVVLALGLAGAANAGRKRLSDEKRAKFIPLFNIITFENGICQSTSNIVGSTGTSNLRSGTCLRADECENQGGSSSGTCVAGFAVCCVFSTSTCGETINQNCTYVRNPGFPSTFATATTCSHTISKCADNICQFRLDFETFSMLGPSITDEMLGGDCDADTFTVGGLNTGSDVIPTICGQNSGQHIYIDVGNTASDTASLNFGFTGASNIRQWEIKVTQIECDSENRAPESCLQYFTGCTGTISTFNYINTGDDTAGQHLSDQQYSTCIRQEEGFCCIKYSLCEDSQFLLDSLAGGARDTDCENDYLWIEGGSSRCATCGTLSHKYCSLFLTDTQTGAMMSTEICDCSAPFRVGVFTDAMLAGTANTIKERGVCLDYSQVPCSGGH